MGTTSEVSSKLLELSKEMLSLKKNGIDPKRYIGIKLHLKSSLESLAKKDRTEKENKLLENLLLGITRIGLLGEDQLKILWDVEKIAALAEKPVSIDEVKRIAVDNMFSEIALNFVCKRENLQQVSTRCLVIKTKYLGLAQTLAVYHDMDGIRKVARKARDEVVNVLYEYDWHAKTVQTA